ncbi:MAG: SPOR domain-containing protein [Spirochaetales bacterium]|nr:SPOR domain-containing protein [Spirochaetales bacterium]
MEQKKILWIILAVVVFVVVVLGAGLIWFRPADVSTADGSAENPDAAGAGFDAIEYIREGEGFPGIEREASEETSEDGFIAVSGEIVYGEDPDASVERTLGEDSDPPVEMPVEAPSVPVKPAPVAAAPVARPAAPVQQPPSKPAPTRTPSRVTEYWIQAGSFQSATRAQEVKDTLGEKGFSPVISTKDVSGTTWFRVRLGPYTNKGEAEKFLEWVKILDGFNESYISEVTVTR